MSISVGDNFSYLGAKPMDGRLKYDTLADMVGMADSTLYDGCMAYCVATDKNYQWKSTNESDATLGKWREFESGDNYSTGDTASTDIADGDYFPFYDSSTSTKKKSLWSNIKSVLKTYFDSIYQATMSAGTGITITGNTINATNTLPLNYSTNEKVVGTWIDSKPIYQKTINFGALSNKSSKSVAHGVENLDIVVEIVGIRYFTNSYEFQSIDYSHDKYTMYQVGCNVTRSTITLTNRDIDLAEQVAYITIRYTKTTD